MGQRPVKYDARHIQVLEGWEAIRKRPGMYIGSTGERGLHQLVYEITGRAVNEALSGRASRVEVALLPDGGVRIADNGPGVPFEGAAGGGVSGLEAQLTQLGHAPARGPQYPVLDFCGAGPFVANALSSRMVAEVQRDGSRWVQEYARGVAVAPPADAGSAVGTGTIITFWPDAEIFAVTECSFDVLAEHFRELTFLNRDLDISLTDERPSEPRFARLRAPGGVRDMVAFLDEQAAAFVHSDVIAFEQEDPRMAGTMEVALRWRGSGPGRIRSFANGRPTPNGGTHMAGFHDGLVAAIKGYALERRLPPAMDADLGVREIGEGLTAVVSVKLEHPEFQGATRSVLENADVRTCVQEAVVEHLASWLEEHPHRAAAVIDQIVRQARGDGSADRRRDQSG